MDKYLRNNNVAKVLALIIGIMLWVVIQMESNTEAGAIGPSLKSETYNNVSVIAEYDENQMYIRSMTPSKVTVVVKGKESALQRLFNTNKLQVELDLTNVPVGTHTMPLTAVGLSGAVTAEVFPQLVTVEIEERQKKEVPIIINVVGTPAAGYKAGQPIVSPNKVYVTLPTSQLNQVVSARADVNVDKATSKVSKQVKLVAHDQNGNAVEGSINPPVVDVEVPITSPFKEMPLQVKLIGQPAAGFSVASLTQSKDMAIIYAPQVVLNTMEFYEAGQLDLTGLRDSKTLTIDIPLKNQVTQVDPAKLEVKVEIVPTSSITLEALPIKIIGQIKGSSVKLISPPQGTIRTVLEGAPALLSKLKPDDVEAIVDVSNLPNGQYELAVVLNLPSFIHRRISSDDVKAIVEISNIP